MSLVLFDINEKPIKFLDDSQIVSAVQTETFDTMTLDFTLDAEVVEFMKNATYVGHVDITYPDRFQLYRILDEKINAYDADYTAIHVFYDEMAFYGYLSDKRPQAGIKGLLDIALQGSRWNVVSNVTTPIKSMSFFYESRLSAISKILKEFDVEISLSLTFKNNVIESRTITVQKERGRITGKRYVYGSNALTVSKETSKASIFTAIIPRGKGEESGDGYGRKLTIKDVEWKKTNGNPVDKPLGSEMLEIPEMTQLFGFSDGNPRVMVVEDAFSDITDNKVLIEEAYKVLVDNSRPLVEFSADVYEDEQRDLGDTVNVIRHDYGIYYSTRVFKLEKDILSGLVTKIEFGDQLSKTATQRMNEYKKRTESKIIQVNEELNKAISSADGKSTNYYGPDEPINPDENDVWFRVNPDGSVTMLVYENGNFVDPLKFDELRADIEANTQLVNDAKLAADKAVAETEQIKADIEDLGDLSTALSQLDDAQTRITDMETQISEAIGNISADFYGDAPTPPYELHQKWYKTEYTPLADKDTGYESIKNTDNVTLDEFSNAGLFICINQKAEGQVFDWNDWKRIATDNTDLLQQIEEGYTYDIQQLEKGYRETLLDYAKSTDLNGLATETYALTVSQTEAGKVSQVLTDYKKTNDTKVENINGRVETTEGNYTTLTQKVDGEVKKLFDVTQTVEGQTTVIKDLKGETGNMSLVEIRQNINEFSSKFVNMPDNITGTVKLDSVGVPIAPYKKGNVWYKDDYNFTQGYDAISTTDNVTLDEFANKGVWVAIKDSANGVFNWSDWQRVSADSSFQLSEIYQDINKIALTVQNNDNNTKSQLLQLSNMIDMTVTKDDLIGQINTQAGNVLIRASADGKSSLLNVTSTGTYIETGIIKNAHIDDGAITRVKIGEAAIDTAKIADAAITSAKILNLDVNKVSGLTSEFVQSKWNAINSSVTITGNGMLVDGDWGGSINFTRRGQTFYDKIKGQVMGYQYGLYRNLDDPLVNSQMLGIYLASEMGYDLRLGVRKQIDNQNNVYMAIKSAGGTATRADVFGATTFFNGINMNGTAITNASNAGYTSTSNPNGICIEFNNGFKIQFKRLSYTTRSTGFEEWTYPKPFSAIPYTFGNAARDDATASNANIAFSNVNERTCNVRISEKENAYSILVCAIGF